MKPKKLEEMTDRELMESIAGNMRATAKSTGSLYTLVLVLTVVSVILTIISVFIMAAT